jgi:hypothetical protein
MSIIIDLAMQMQMLSLQLQLQQSKEREEISKTEREHIKATAAGVRGVSLQPSQLCKQMINRQVEPWFKPLRANLSKFNYSSDVLEASVQSNWQDVFKKLHASAASNGVHWWDGHKTFWLKQPHGDDSNRKAPDGVAVADRPVTGRYPDHHLVLAITDNKCSRHGKFTNDDKGKLFEYCVTLLQFYQTLRHCMPCSLFDGRYAQCFLVSRSELRKTPYIANFTRVFDLSMQEDMLLYGGFLSDRDSMWYNISKLHTNVGDCIGYGASGLVFSHIGDPCCVIKIPYTSSLELVEYEREVYKTLITSSPGLSCIHPEDDDQNHFLLLRNKFERLNISFGFDVSILCSLIDRKDAPLCVLHAQGWVHCDIRPENIMQIPGLLRLALVDLGAARRISAPPSIYDHGTLHFASDRVRGAYFSKNPVTLEPADDLISLARCILLLQVSALSFRDTIHELGQDQEKISLFWGAIEKRRFAVQLMRLANQTDYVGMCALIHQEYDAFAE